MRHVNDLADVPDFSLVALSEMNYKATQSRDRALTAFAQLAALRLGVRRATVSLIDQKHQYILAEATRTISLVDDNRHGEHDGLWLGSTILARADAVCECALRRSYSVEDDEGNTYTGRGAVITDLTDDPDYKHKPYTVREPGLRFYAGVPIKSRNGHLIGTYAVSDENPRHPLTYDEFRFMEDIAVSIMDHLEWARDRVDRYKGERIVRGMADFIDGSPSIKAYRVERDLDDQSHGGAEAEVPTAGPAPDSIYNEEQIRAAALSPRLSPQGSHITNIPQVENIRKPPRSDNQGVPSAKREKVDNLTRLLDRAAKILRQSTLAEGVVFFGPNANDTNAKSSLRTALSAKERFASDREGTGTGTDEERRGSCNEGAEGEPSTDSDTGSRIKNSKILGISLTNKRDASLFHNTALAVPTLENYFRL